VKNEASFDKNFKEEEMLDSFQYIENDMQFAHFLVTNGRFHSRTKNYKNSILKDTPYICSAENCMPLCSSVEVGVKMLADFSPFPLEDFLSEVWRIFFPRFGGFFLTTHFTRLAKQCNATTRNYCRLNKSSGKYSNET
jgi:hypothetical protein